MLEEERVLERPDGTDFIIDGVSNYALLPGIGDNRPRSNPGDRFHHLFAIQPDQENNALGSPQGTIEWEDETVSLADLNVLANQIGHYLQKRGAQPGDVIALLFDRSVYAYASILAASKIGCTFVPLDVSFPTARVQFICEDSGVKFALTTSAHVSCFCDCNTHTIALDDARSEYRDLAPSAPIVPNDGAGQDAVCYVIYTSGTTGNPKGVPINHTSICNFLLVAAQEYGFTEDDRVFQSLTLAFDYSFEEIWVPLLCGACLVPAPPGVNLLGDDLAHFLTDKRITAWCSVPTILATIDEDLPLLRLLIVSGEACPEDLMKRWWTKERRFLNLYGPTETTVSATWKVFQNDGSVTIGSPLPTYTAMILSPDKNRLLDVNEVGELGLAGIGLADGYLNREKETSKAFIQDFVGIDNNPGGRIYRTGDLARINEDDQIEYLGRVDTQVKIRGYRIELEEIETIARELSGLSSLVVNPVQIDNGDAELVAYFVAKPEDNVDVIKLHHGLRERLPPYMVPAYFERLDNLPLLASQKADRQQLPNPSDFRLSGSDEEFVEPAEGLESDLAGVLAELLKIERVSVDADFFEDLGANSLLMARYLGSLKKQTGIKTSMRMIYQNKTVRELAVAIARGSEASADANYHEFSSSTCCLNASNGDEFARQGSATLNYIACGTAQVAWMFLMAFFAAVAGVAVFKWLLATDGLWSTIGRAFVAGNGLFVATTLAMIAIKWIAVGRFQEEVIPVWTFRYFRFWVAQTAVRGNPMNLFVGTPVYNVFLRLVGAKIGKGSLIFCPPPVCTDLVSVGENTVIRQKATFNGYTARNGRLHLGAVKIGSNCYLGEATVLDIHSELGDNAQLGNRSALHERQKAQGGKSHVGSPAIVCDTDFIRVPELDISPARAWLYTLGQFLFAALITGPLFAAVALMMIKYFVTANALTSGAAATSINYWHIAGLSLVFYFVGIVLALVSVSIMPKIWNIFFRPNEVHKMFSFQYFLAQRIMGSSASPSLQALFGDSALIVPYFKAIGYDLKLLKQNGSNFGVQQSHHSPFLCKFNNNTLVSDGLHLVNTDLSSTSFKMSQISTPKDAFLGNDLHYPTGAKVGENCLIATKAMVPIDGEIRTDVGILGSPPFEISRPKEQNDRADHYLKEGIFEQRLQMKLKSNLITLAWFMVRNWSMAFFSLAVGFWIYASFAEALFASNVLAGAVLAAFGLGALFFRSFYNILYERVANWHRPMKPRNCSLYERPFWDHERVWKLNIDTARSSVFNGTPIKNLVSRAQGMKIGKQVFDDGCDFPDPSLVEIGDYSTLNHGSVVQGHSMEDGIFKANFIRIGSRSTLGVEVFVHYGTEIGDDADVRTDAFVMKGSVIGESEIWTGNPAGQIVPEQSF